MNANERGMEMLKLPMGQLPPVATLYLKDLTGRTGMCIEVCLSCYIAYAHVVEGLPLDPNNHDYDPPPLEVGIIVHIKAAYEQQLMVFLDSAGMGCISGNVHDWSQLKPACRWAFDEITRLREQVKK